MNGRKSLAVRLALVTLLTTGSIFFISSGALYLMVRDIMLEHAEDQARELTHATANRIRSSLNEVAGSAQGLASALNSGQIRPDGLFPVLDDVTLQSDAVQGAAVTFEPYAADPDERYYGPFSYETPNGIARMHLGGDDFDYFTRDWYQIPALTRSGFWTEPFPSAADPNRLITTYSRPFFAPDDAEALRGIVTMDIELPALTARVDEVEIFDSGFAFLVSPRTRFITYPQRDWIMRESLFSLAETRGEPELRELGRRIQQTDEGFSRVPEALLEEPARLYHVRLPEANWAVGVIIPERELFGDILRVMHWVLIIAAIGFFILLGTIIGISRGITRPLKGLASSAGEIARGNLDRPLPPIRTGDEVGQLAHSLDEMRLSLKDYINDLTATTAAKERMESELKIARNIQMSFLPKRLDLSDLDVGIDLAARLIPAKEVGGDLYDFFPLREHNALFFAVGDVSDKGVPAALFMAVTKTLVKGIAEQDPRDPGEILTRVNNELCLNNDNGMFVTYLCGVLDLGTGEVRFANAGHNPPLIHRADGTYDWLKLPPGLVLGAMEDMEYPVQTVRLAPGDALLLYTDGVTEAADEEQKLYDEDRLFALYGQIASQPARQQVDAVLESVERFADGATQADDITVLALRYCPGDGECAE
ncbi:MULTISPECIES: SpoIIE family protein phosphatase [unclassified Thioalkalivibrio]|uniref:SpoIIE family protein phosphatase n=1 Tax=unclassified Thioalkalivibrio TaxID=2621013 RepID=UPI00037BB24F|nr:MULTISPECIES: SpoIIE family protein phosphatase [unclassified Thioalkalivibrio]